MPISSQITDGEGQNIKAGVKATEEFGNGLKVYPLLSSRKENRTGVFLNPEYGSDMNQNAATSGTPLIIHNGTDTSAWTGSEISGTKVTFDSTGRPYEGTKSVKIDNPNLNDEWQFAGASVNVADYVTLTFWINIDKDWSSGDSIEIFGWDTGTASIVGTSVLLEEYVNESNFDVWQKASIPLLDFTLTSGSIDAIRMIQIGKAGKAAKWYLDTMQLEESGEPICFSIAPPLNQVWEIQNVQFTMVDTFDSTVINGTMQNIPYQGLLGVGSLSTGINITRIQNNETIFSIVVNNFIDLVIAPSNTSILSGSDGTDTWVKLSLSFPSPFRLNGNSKDRVEITINDNLTGLILFKATSSYALDIVVE